MIAGRLALVMLAAAAPVAAQDMPGMVMPPAIPSTPPAPAAPMQGMDHADHGAPGAKMDMGAMTAALGAYPMTREASGTSWQPDASEHAGIHVAAGRWDLMVHATFNGVYDRQEGRRGDDKAFASGMVMAIATRRFAGGDTLRFRGMLSPDPLMGKSGYPVLLASGETADGIVALVDRQHPHDLFMELSASYSHQLSANDSIFVYGGLPGEPAFGPPAFMHRLSIMDSPEAPISHHWLDSTHITFGVVTAGFVHDTLKVEASRFRGREPDQFRYNIETGALDSTAARVAWNPTRALSLQVSWARQISPEQLEPDDDTTKWSASAIFTRAPGDDGWWSATAAWGRRSSDGEQLDAFVLEAAVKPNRDWTVFARAERTDNNELVAGPGGGHGPTYTVGKASLGAVRDFAVADRIRFGVGGLYARNFVPPGLDAAYGGDRGGAMAFVRLKVE